jgi:hypothetical protein
MTAVAATTAAAADAAISTCRLATPLTRCATQTAYAASTSGSAGPSIKSSNRSVGGVAAVRAGATIAADPAATTFTAASTRTHVTLAGRFTAIAASAADTTSTSDATISAPRAG